MINRKKILFSILLSAILFSSPTIIGAAFEAGTRPTVTPVNAGGAPSPILTDILTNTFSLIWILFIAFAVIMFIIAGFQFLSAQGESDGVKKAEKSILWGSIGVAVGIISFTLPFIIRAWIF